MEKLKEITVVVLAYIAWFFACISCIGLVVLLFMIPFMVIGFGLSFIVWATCLPLTMC